MKGLLAFFEGGTGGLKADESQRLALQTLEDFVMSDRERGVQVISGPAGSGKTFMMRSSPSWYFPCSTSYPKKLAFECPNHDFAIFNTKPRSYALSSTSLSLS